MGVCASLPTKIVIEETKEMVGVVIAGAAAVPLIFSAALGAVGFGAGGVIAGSIAAGWQAAVGNVVAGSAFAAAQSAAAAAGAGGAAAAGTGYMTSSATLASWSWMLYLAPMAAAYVIDTRN